MTLKQWLLQTGANKYFPLRSHAPSVGIHDTAALDANGVRSQLWGLSDYRVSTVQAGVIWLAPKEKACFPETISA